MLRFFLLCETLDGSPQGFHPTVGVGAVGDFVSTCSQPRLTLQASDALEIRIKPLLPMALCIMARNFSNTRRLLKC